jgi:demethylmenaquinone methyltransferase/2-methoxy-6-polyprenyl-1,4-benzoquinol methylase
VRPTDARNLFDRNAATYDWVNSVISLGLDARWRNWIVEQAVVVSGGRILDACSGTGEVGLRAAIRGAHVTLADISPVMLSIAKERAGKLGVAVDVRVADLAGAQSVFDLAGDVEGFDAITLSFALRYIEDKGLLLSRLAGLLKPGGRLIILEFVNPPRRPVSMAAAVYFYHILPVIGSLLAGRRELYSYLVSSVAQIGRAGDLERLVGDAGLSVIDRRGFGFGLVCGVVASQRIVHPLQAG